MRRKDYRELKDTLGLGLLNQMTGLSQKNLRELPRWKNLSPKLHDRLKFLNELASRLAGTYNSIGIRLWFSTKFQPLDNKSPIDILQGNWNPTDPMPQKILSIAKPPYSSAGT